MSTGAFSDRQFTPALRPGDIVQLDPLTVGPNNDPRIHPVRQFVQAFGIHADSVTVNANSTNRDNELTSISMPDGFLGQHRLLAPGVDIPQGVNVTVDHGGQEAPYGTSKNTRSEFENSTGTEQGYDEDANSPTNSWGIVSSLLEFWTWENNPPYFTFENTTASQVTIDMTFVGYHYKLGSTVSPDEVPGEPVHVPVERIRSSR